MPPFSAHKRENGDIVARVSQVGVHDKREGPPRE